LGVGCKLLEERPSKLRRNLVEASPQVAIDRGTPSPTLGAVSRFGPFAVDASRAELTRDGVTIGLRPKTYALLTHFAAHPGVVLAKADLLAAVWPGVVVNEESLSQCARGPQAAPAQTG